MSDSSIYMQALFCGDIYFLDDIVAVYRVRKERGLSLTSYASLPFIMNVLYQKEKFYYRSITLLPHPKKFWSHHYKMSYVLFSNKQGFKMEKVKVLLWGLTHSHGSVRIVLFILKSLLGLMVRK